MTELLTMAQLDFVSGGSGSQDEADKKFFRQLGYNMDKLGLKDAFLDNGIDFTNNYPHDNYYQICLKDKGWNCHPQWAFWATFCREDNIPASTAAGRTKIIQKRSSKKISALRFEQRPSAHVGGFFI